MSQDPAHFLATSSLARVRRCGCGVVDVTVGHTSLRFTDDDFASLVLTLTTAMTNMPRDAVDASLKRLFGTPAAGVAEA